MLRYCMKTMQIWHKLKLDFHNDPYEDDHGLWFKIHATGQHNIHFLIQCSFI